MMDGDSSEWAYRWSRAKFDALPETGDPLSKSRVFELLASVRRRYVIEHLDEVADGVGGVEFRAVTDAVAAREFGADPSYEERKRVYVSLRQTHLPRLTEANAVEYDADRGRVAVGDHFGALAFALGAVGARPFAAEVDADAHEAGPKVDTGPSAADARSEGPVDAGAYVDSNED
ncbi:DUF7344 domain-containing protein [Halobaculum limi]|uniref:DUF7344 domain-containing protein n=1 Tax=Halobaculum limi TaxID=3031916 RepID=UPI002406F23B|nr:hypothetical protein [Halobaculum sp. YSMS11]